MAIPLWDAAATRGFLATRRPAGVQGRNVTCSSGDAMPRHPRASSRRVAGGRPRPDRGLATCSSRVSAGRSPSRPRGVPDPRGAGAPQAREDEPIGTSGMRDPTRHGRPRPHRLHLRAVAEQLGDRGTVPRGPILGVPRRGRAGRRSWSAASSSSETDPAASLGPGRPQQHRVTRSSLSRTPQTRSVARPAPLMSRDRRGS